MLEQLRRRPYAAALSSGLLVGISFPPSTLGALAWIGLVPLLIRLTVKLDWRTVAVESIVASTIAVGIAGYWTLFHPIRSAQIAAIAGLLGLGVTSAIPYICFGLVRRVSAMTLRFGILLASLALVEYAQFHTEIGFPWLVLGHTQASLAPINQLAAFVGAGGLSVWVLTTNILVAAVVLATAPRGRLLLLGSLGLFLGGSLVLGLVHQTTGREVLRWHNVLAVQPGLPPDAWSDIRDRDRPADLMRVTRTFTGGDFELVVWPETALPVLEARDRPSADYLTLAGFVDSLGVPLLAGAVIRTEVPDSGSVYYNSAVLLSPFVGITGRYDKRRLVPFAERVPYIDRFPWLESLSVPAGGVAGYGLGERSNVLSYDKTQIGLMICFESAFSSAAEVPDGGKVAYYVVLAQDGWWGETAGFRQHFALTKLRAIETGRSFVQVTVTGTTGVVLPDGSSDGETAWMERTARHLRVPEFAGATPYSRHGDFPVVAFTLLVLIAGLLSSTRASDPKLVE